MPERIGLIPIEEAAVAKGPTGTAASRSEGRKRRAGTTARLALVDVARPGVVDVRPDRYRLTAKALRTLEIRDIAGHEVWEILDGSRRMTKRLGVDAAVVFGVTDAGRCLVLLALESVLEAQGWDVVAARELSADEVGLFASYLGKPR